MLRISSPEWEEHSRENTISELLLEADRHLSAIMDVGLGSVVSNVTRFQYPLATQAGEQAGQRRVRDQEFGDLRRSCLDPAQTPWQSREKPLPFWV